MKSKDVFNNIKQVFSIASNVATESLKALFMTTIQFFKVTPTTTRNVENPSAVTSAPLNENPPESPSLNNQVSQSTETPPRAQIRAENNIDTDHRSVPTDVFSSEPTLQLAFKKSITPGFIKSVLELNEGKKFRDQKELELKNQPANSSPNSNNIPPGPKA